MFHKLQFQSQNCQDCMPGGNISLMSAVKTGSSFEANATLRIVFTVFFTSMFLIASPALAQNPQPAACGLPTEGVVDLVTSVTYTLTQDCTQTGKLWFLSSQTIMGTVSVEGNGHTINATALTGISEVINIFAPLSLNMNNVTIDGGGGPGSGALFLGGPANITNVTIRNSLITAFATTYRVTGNLRNILIEGVRGVYYSHEHRGSALDSTSGGNFTVTNMVIRDTNNEGSIGNAAVSVFPNEPPGSITLNGCLTIERVFPRKFYGDGITNNSSGPCSGTIGNGDPAVKSLPEPAPAACGLPAEGLLQRSAVFTLTGDCFQTDTLYIPWELEVVIDGNGHIIHCPPDASGILTAAKLTIRNVVITGCSAYVLRTFSVNDTLIENSTFRNNGGPVNILDHRAVIRNSRFENHSLDTTAVASVARFLEVYGGSALLTFLADTRTTVRDSVFRNNQGGRGAIYIGSITTLEGCITLENNAPVNIDDPNSMLVDNSSGPCSEDGGLNIGAPPVGSTRKTNRRFAPGQEGRTDGCEIPVGVVACIYRVAGGDAGNPGLEIRGISELATEFHLLTVNQEMVDATSGGNVVSVSPDGRALVVVWDDGNVTIKVGPDHENKILHVTLAGGLAGPVIGMITTYGGPPGEYLLAG